MSTFEVTLEEIEVLDHPNADSLQLARIGGYRAVIPKGEFVTGQTVVYIPEQSVLPQPLITFMRLEGRLSGPQKDRVKAVRLRGELSQGLVMSIRDFKDYIAQEHGVHTGLPDTPIDNFLEFCQEQLGGSLHTLIGVEKWVPEIPVEMQGKLEHVNSIVKWPDIENVKKFTNIFGPDDLVCATEKIHGTCCGVTLDIETNTFSVYSKGLSKQGLALVESPSNVYWRAIRTYVIEESLRHMASVEPIKRIAIFGEVYGQGVQDLGYGHDTKELGPGYAAFDIWVQYENEEGFFVSPGDFVEKCEEYGIPVVPVLYNGFYDYDTLEKLSCGESLVGGDHIREGLVVRPLDPDDNIIRHENPDDPTRYSEARRICKFINPDYLMRKGNNLTEFE